MIEEYHIPTYIYFIGMFLLKFVYVIGFLFVLICCARNETTQGKTKLLGLNRLDQNLSYLFYFSVLVFMAVKQQSPHQDKINELKHNCSTTIN